MPIVSVKKLEDADIDCGTLEEVINGEPNKRIKTRLGREVWTLASVPLLSVYTIDETEALIDKEQNRAKNAEVELQNSKADKVYVDQLVIDAQNNIQNFKTEVELLAFTPGIENYTAKALDTKKVWLWDGVQWNDTGLSELDLAKEFSNSNPNFKSELLGDRNLNDVIKDGSYLATISQNSTSANNYPVISGDGRFGVLKVHHTLTGSSGSLLIQVFYCLAGKGVYTRSKYLDYTWGAWVKTATTLDLIDLENKIALDLNKIFSDLNKKSDILNVELKNLYDDLHNPLMSVNIKLIGDSITWGTGASNSTSPDPRNGTLTDARNTTDPISPSWANLLRRFLCSAYTDGALVHSGGGVAYSENENIILLSREVRRFTFKNTTFNKTLSNSEVVQKVAVNAVAESKEHLDIVNVQSSDSTLPTELSFSMNGSGFKVEHAVFASGAVETYYASVYVDGVFLQKINLNGAAAAYTSTYITLPNNGKHTILIKNDGQQNSQLRITAIKSIKHISIANDGINGSSSRSWLSSVTLASSITRKDDYVFVQLGTNDRITSVNNTYGSLAKNLKQIVSDIYALSSNNAKVILIGANAVTQDENPSTSSYFMNMRTINNIVYSVAKEKNVSFISNFEATEQLKIDGTSYLADGLHPNDLGHRTIFENIKNRILIK